jgi:hypothetical protein
MTRRQMKRRHARRTADKRRNRSRAALGTGIALGAILGSGGAAQAAEFTVTSGSEFGAGGVREAVEDANANPGADDIVFAATVTGSINLDSELAITDPVHIHGPGVSSGVELNANQHGRVFRIDTPSADDLVTISDLSMRRGFGGAAGGGNILVETGDLTLDRVDAVYGESDGPGGSIRAAEADTTLTVIDSEVNGIAQAAGGGISVANGDLVVRGSSILIGAAYGPGGGIAIEGADATIEKSTIAENIAREGSGVFVGAGGTAEISESTIARNRTDGPDPVGVGLAVEGGATLESTIVADNTRETGSGEVQDDLHADGGTINATASLIESGAGAINGTNVANITGQDPALGRISGNGGLTATIRPEPGSPAIDNGLGTGLDQRGVPRPVDDPAVANGSAPGANGSDIGSVEVQPSGPQTVTNLAAQGAGSLLNAVIAAEDTASATTIGFADGLEGTIPVDSPLRITTPVDLEGPGADALTLDAGGSGRLLSVSLDPAEEVSIDGLTLTGGKANDAGAVSVNGGALNVADSEISGNQGNRGGAISAFQTALTVESSTLADNVTTGAGGAIYAEASDLTVHASTISGNESGNRGGGVYIYDYYTGGSTSITDSTITANESVPEGGGLQVYGAPAGPVTLTNTILAGNQAPTGTDLVGEVDASFSLFGALDGDAEVTETVAGSNRTGAPQLGSLALNGGTTRTHAPAFASPAVDAGSSGDPDQRGTARPFDIPTIASPAATGANGADIGAVELDTLPPATGGGGAQPAPAPTKSRKKKKCKKKAKKGNAAAAAKKCKKGKKRKK